MAAKPVIHATADFKTFRFVRWQALAGFSGAIWASGRTQFVS